MASEASMDGQFLQRLASLLDAHLGEERFGVKELAREIGLSRSQLHRKLQNLKHKSTSQYIREYRLQKAMELLQADVGTASEIAYRVGFSSPTYFSSCFHNYYGYPPGEVKFRKNGAMDRPAPKIGAGNPKKMLVQLILLAILLLAVTSFAVYLRDSNGTRNMGNTIPAAIEGEISEMNKSIGVLPFVNLSGDPEFEYISDGLTDEIISQLTKIKNFTRVVPFTTMLSYKKTNKSVEEIASELGITHLLEGNVQKAGDTVKIVLRLIDGMANTYDWSADFKAAWKVEDLFEMQSEVAENVARNMQVSISAEDKANIRQLPTINTEAYTFYQQADYQRIKGGSIGYKNAKSLYEKAISLDPNYVDAYLGLAFVWMMQGLHLGAVDERVAWDNAKAILEKLQRTAPSRKEVEYDLFMGYYFFDWNFALVNEYYLKQRSKGVFGDCSWLANFAQKTGRTHEALDIVDSFIEYEPGVGKHYAHKAHILVNLHRMEEASALLRHTDSLYTDNLDYIWGSAMAHYVLREYKKSRQQLEIIKNNYSDRPAEIIWLDAVLLKEENKAPQSLELFGKLVKLYETGSSGSPAWYIALYYMINEEYDLGFSWLEKSYERHEVALVGLIDTPVLRPVAKDPRYKELIHKVGFYKAVPL